VWDISPTSLLWSNIGNEIYIRGKERAREKLWTVPVANPGRTLEIRHIPIEIDPSGAGDIIEVYNLSKEADDQWLLINRSKDHTTA
jgi:hypothetical protein